MENLDKNGLKLKVCTDCGQDSNKVDFHFDKTNKNKYYSKRCIECQNIYRHELRCREIKNKNCRTCDINSKDAIFDFYKLPDKKVYHSNCRECIKENEKELGKEFIPERFCHICEISSFDKDFRIKYYAYTDKNYYTKLCKDCNIFNGFRKLCEKFNVKEEICKYCKESSLNKRFGYYKLREKVLLYDYCYDCRNKNTKPGPKICSECEKTSMEVKFDTRKAAATKFSIMYCNICSECVINKRKSRTNTLERKLKIYKKGASNRNYEWNITKDKAYKLFLGDCYYCGKESKEHVELSGIDRINNELGYIDGNCVSCCGFCNQMKGTEDQKEFIQKCIDISEKHKNGISYFRST